MTPIDRDPATLHPVSVTEQPRVIDSLMPAERAHANPTSDAYYVETLARAVGVLKEDPVDYLESLAKAVGVLREKVEAPAVVKEERVSEFEQPADEEEPAETSRPTPPVRRIDRTFVVPLPAEEPSSIEVDKRRPLEIGQAELPLHGEDKILIDTDNELFAVFDGVGSGSGSNKAGSPDEASNAAAEMVRAVISEIQPKNEQDALRALRQSFLHARQKLGEVAPDQATTAIVAKFIDTSTGRKLVWANAGDSLLYLQRKDGTLKLINTDQSMGNIVFNTLRPYRSEGDSPDEFGVESVEPGDQIMLCSDGITGDWSHQKLTNSEFQQAFAQPSAEQAAAQFLAFSTKPSGESTTPSGEQFKAKRDDKSVIVVRV